MSKEELIKRTRECLREVATFGGDPGRVAEEIVDGCIKLAKEEAENPPLEDLVSKIKKLAQKKGLGAEVTIKYA